MKVQLLEESFGILHETPGFFGHPKLDTKDLVGQVLDAGTDSSSGSSTSFKNGQICCIGCTVQIGASPSRILERCNCSCPCALCQLLMYVHLVHLCFYHLYPLPADVASQARSWVSPVFLHAAHGRIMPGLPAVDPGVPLLLVGNHQLLLD